MPYLDPEQRREAARRTYARRKQDPLRLKEYKNRVKLYSEKYYSRPEIKLHKKIYSRLRNQSLSPDQIKKARLRKKEWAKNIQTGNLLGLLPKSKK